jgi:ribosome-binding protein aMBF1 (putative translation factor)
MSMGWKDLKRELMRDDEFVKEYEELAPEYDLARSIISLRIKKGMTQKELADRMDTTQSVISRLESGRAKPSLATLEKLAKALDGRVVARIE